MDWVVWENYFETLCNDFSNLGRETFEECCVVVVQGDPATVEEGASDSQKIPVIFYDVSLVTDFGLSRKFYKGFEALLRVPGGRGNVGVEGDEVRLKVVPICVLRSGQSLPEALQGARDVA